MPAARRVMLGLLAALASLLLPISATQEWRQYGHPAEAGWSSDRLERARLRAEGMGTTAVLVIVRGRVLAAWGDISRRCPLHSIRKSLVAALIGIHAAAGQIGLDMSMAELGIDDLQSLTPQEKRATVRDLLRCTSGIYHPAAKETREMKRLRPVRGSHATGEFWYYNNWDCNVLGAILEQEAKVSLADDFQERIATPLGLEDFRPRDIFAQYERHLSRHPAFTFRLSARDLARFGLLCLNRGSWQNLEILPPRWLEESWTPASRVGSATFFGFSWWIYPRKDGAGSRAYPNLYRQDRYAAWGLGGQLLLVIPEADMVIVHLVDTDTTPPVPGKKIWELAEAILASRSGPPQATPFLEPLTPTPFKNARPAAREHREIVMGHEALREFVGDFQFADRRRLRLRLGDGILIATLGDREIDFFPGAPSYFFARAENIQIAFSRDQKHRVSGLILIIRGNPQKAKKSSPSESGEDPRLEKSTRE